jgi:hypothetical protein
MFASYANGGTGSHLVVDDCGRVWSILTEFGIRIYDPLGTEIGNWPMSNSTHIIFDLLFLPNYVLLVTHRQARKIVRYDPQMACS